MTWQQIRRQNITKWEQLADHLELDAEQRRQIIVDAKFPLNVPLRLVQKMEKRNLDDPILRQFLPTIAEKVLTADYQVDPVCDVTFQQTSKLLRKYKGRVLLICSSACAMHCRYCFRHNFDYDTTDKQFEEELVLIAADPTIHEVILSGGDPLSLPDSILHPLLKALSAIPHISRIRFHTRFPIGIPERIDPPFLDLLQQLRPQVWFIIHSNHAREIDDEVATVLAQVHKSGAVVLNQSVLLKGVNDTTEALQALCERLVDCGIMPYYIHQLDRVQGSAHFEVTESEGKKLIDSLTQQLSGYAIPKYVKEMPGESSKTAIV
jgi:EF-P beta-lysylation protein EpmB